LLPEIAARLGIDAGGRLIEQQKPRRMNQAGSEREPLLPPAGELAGELLLPGGKAKLIEALLHRLPAILHVVHARHEIEIFSNAEVFPKAEFLGHVADMTLDLLALTNHVVAEAGAAPGIRAQQAAEHADEGRLATAVGPEEPVNLTGPDLQRDVIDHRCGRQTAWSCPARRSPVLRSC